MTTDIANVLAKRLQEEPSFGVVSAYLFGSEAEGRSHRESDMDVGVLLARDHFPTSDARFEQRLLLMSRLAGVLKGGPWTSSCQTMPHRCWLATATRGLRLFCSDAEADHAFVRDAQLRAADIEPFLRRMRWIKLERLSRPWLAQLRRHLDHLGDIRSRVTGPEALERDLSLHNDVLFSLLTICQLVMDIAGELGARRGDRFEDYTELIRGLARDARFEAPLIRRLERLPGFRNVLVHEYVALDLTRVVQALDELDDIRQFIHVVSAIEAARPTPSSSPVAGETTRIEDPLPVTRCPATER